MGEEEMPGLSQRGAAEDYWHGKNRYQIQIHPQSKVEWWNLAIMPILPEMLTTKSYPAIQQLATNLSPPSKRVKNYEMLNPLQQFRTRKISIQLKMLRGLPGTRPIKPKMTKDWLRGGYIFSQEFSPQSTAERATKRTGLTKLVSLQKCEQFKPVSNKKKWKKEKEHYENHSNSR